MHARVLIIASTVRQVPGERALEGAQNLLRIGGFIGAEDDRARMQRILVRGRKRREQTGESAYRGVYFAAINTGLAGIAGAFRYNRTVILQRVKP